jgi:hypothetical protein
MAASLSVDRQQGQGGGDGVGARLEKAEQACNAAKRFIVRANKKLFRFPA